MSLKLMLETAAGRYADKTAIVSGDRRLSYTELDEASNKVASALIAMGVNKGDRVAMLLNNSPEFVIIYFGIVKIAAIAVPLDTNCKVAEFASFFSDFLPKVLIGENNILQSLAPILPEHDSIKYVIDLDAESNDEFISYQQIIAAGSTRKVDDVAEPEDIAQIAYTSGSSYCPKGIVLTHHHLVTEAGISSGGFQQTDRDIVMLFALPMYHMFGLVAVLLSSLSQGSTVVIVPGTGLSVGSFLTTIEQERGTMYLGIPYIFTLLVNIAEKEGIKSNLSSIRLWCSAGAPLPLDIAQRFQKYYGFKLLDVWGLTETVCHITCPSLDGQFRPGSVGKALPGWEVKVVDDNGRELPLGHQGEILATGLLMTGYHNNPQATDEAVKDGWLYTGDIGKLNEDKYLFITGRKKDLIITKGQNIHPCDIEHVLSTHPKVAEAAAIGIPDELRGEVVGAVITPKAGEVVTEPEIKRYCLERLANYKVPKKIVFLDSLPRNTAGNIDKEAIRRQLSIPSLF